MTLKQLLAIWPLVLVIALCAISGVLFFTLGGELGLRVSALIWTLAFSFFILPFIAYCVERGWM